MRINFFSFIMSVLSGSVLIILIFLLTKNKRFNKRLGLTSIVILYIFSVARVLLPLDLSPSIPLKIPDIYGSLYGFLNSPVVDTENNKYHPEASLLTYIDIVFLVIVVVALVLIIRHSYSYFKFIKNINRCPDYSTKKERRIFVKEVEKIGFKRNPSFKVIDAHIVPMTYGIIKPVVVLPCNEYTDEELSYIIKHELIHQKNHDTLLKFLIAIYCCIFWWNPLSYLLKHDLSRRLELKCDERTTLDFSERQKLAYLSVIIKTMKMSTSADKKLACDSTFVSSEFAMMTKSEQIKERFDYVLNSSPKQGIGKLFNFVLAFVCLFVFVLSYIFIFVPAGEEPPESELWGQGVTLVADEENSYVLVKADGSCYFCLGDETPVEISAEDVKNGLYKGYPIKYEE